jgi:NAD(P)-dependent dehydrogenase (short-subunit alcohol dehydrogenase family)
MIGFDGLGVVVTGAGNGIGRALASRFATAGARVIVNDLDPAAATKVAQEIGATAVAGDAASESGVADLIEAARANVGDIDVYCANAGVVGATGPNSPEEGWRQAWEVNVMAHVRASQALLPAWLQRGRGRFVVTASAAGLLTMLGSAPYSVSKHAAVAYAEWLAATYSHRGIAVHCVCPQGVRTRMLDDTGAAGDVLLRPAAIEPEQVADAVWEGMQQNRFLILPHPEVRDYYIHRATDPDRWLRGMNKLQQRIDDAP